MFLRKALLRNHGERQKKRCRSVINWVLFQQKLQEQQKTLYYWILLANIMFCETSKFSDVCAANPFYACAQGLITMNSKMHAEALISIFHVSNALVHYCSLGMFFNSDNIWNTKINILDTTTMYYLRCISVRTAFVCS